MICLINSQHIMHDLRYALYVLVALVWIDGTPPSLHTDTHVCYIRNCCLFFSYVQDAHAYFNIFFFLKR